MIIKYPDDHSKMKASLKNIIVGQRIFINGESVTCVHICKNKYIFSMDNVFERHEHSKIEGILKELYRTGCINRRKIFSDSILEDIDFLFIPNSQQIFGIDTYSKGYEQFDWFKRGRFTLVKGLYAPGEKFHNQCIDWWLSDESYEDSGRYLYVTTEGTMETSYPVSFSGIPIFFQMTL